jgi:hypothetical protein
MRLDLFSILVHDLESNYNGKEREGAAAAATTIRQ